jgi:hypothetical protein
MTQTTPSGAPSMRTVTSLLILLAGAVVAGAAGLLAYAGGATVPNAVLAGGGAYATAVFLGLALTHYAAGGGDRS